MKPGRPTLYTKDDLLDAALTVARSVGYRRMTREAVAHTAGCSAGQVSHLLGTMVQLRRAVLRAALRRGDLPVIAQALIANDPHVKALAPSLKRAALESVL
jgi:AcrR family transcriptional regulator